MVGDATIPHPALSPFTGNPGLKVDVPDDSEPLDFFYMMFDENMWSVIADQTNIYAQNVIDSAELSTFSRQRKWQPITVDEMKVFFGLIVSMGLVRKPDVVDYWCSDETARTPFFSKNMSKDRFLSIMSNLHLADNSQANDDRLYKVRTFINMLNKNFDKYEPEQNLSLDEGTCPFKGRVLFRVYNPAKPNKWGMKLYKVCESSSGYCLGFDVYDGSQGCAIYSELVDTDFSYSQTTCVCVGLLARCGLLHKGHVVYMNNYYNSPQLADELSANDTYVCGTVRVNRKEMPKSFPQTKLKTGEVVYRRRENTLVMKFHDKLDVHMISTYHRATSTLLNRLGRDGLPIVKPTAVVDYCKNMGGVDISDQVQQYYEPLRRTVKWWKKLFFHLWNLMVVNAYKLYLRYGNPRSKRSHQNFRSQLVKALIESAPNAPKPQPRGGRKAEPIGRLIGRHFPMFIPAKPGAKRAHPQRDCVACNLKVKDRVGYKRKQTIYMCDVCEVPLCMPDCFRVYHTYKHYQNYLHGGGNESDSD